MDRVVALVFQRQKHLLSKKGSKESSEYIAKVVTPEMISRRISLMDYYL